MISREEEAITASPISLEERESEGSGRLTLYHTTHGPARDAISPESAAVAEIRR